MLTDHRLHCEAQQQKHEQHLQQRTADIRWSGVQARSSVSVQKYDAPQLSMPGGFCRGATARPEVWWCVQPIVRRKTAEVRELRDH